MKVEKVQLLDQPKVFTWVIVTCSLFIGLTFVGMLTYVGGNDLYPDATTYSFSYNFFSSLGLTEAYGKPNTVAAVLFPIALTGAGVGLILFSLAFARFFSDERIPRTLSWFGILFGLLSGICFIGVAAAPADLFRAPHIWFVQRAFQFLAITIIFFTAAIFTHKSYPKRYGALFTGYAVLVMGYVYLLFHGPSIETASGLLIQAVSQKIIVYASMIVILIQSWKARALRNGKAHPQQTLKQTLK